MRRRELILAAGAVFTHPFAGYAQLRSTPVLGYLSIQSATLGMQTPTWAGFHRGLGEAGFVDGKSLVIEYRWAEEKPDRLPELAAELVRKQVTAIFTLGGPAPALAAKATTERIPIVFYMGGDPVKSGLVASLNRPEANVTGVTLITSTLGPKRLELLRELIHRTGAIAILVDPEEPDSRAELERVQAAAEALGQQTIVVRANVEDQLDGAFRQITRQRCAGILVCTGGFFGNRPSKLAALAAQYAVPAIYDRRAAVDAGGLISYGTDFAEIGRIAGLKVARVLDGENPADLPVEQPTKFELAVNLKTAKVLGLTVPQVLLAQANEVIE